MSSSSAAIVLPVSPDSPSTCGFLDGPAKLHLQKKYASGAIVANGDAARLEFGARAAGNLAGLIRRIPASGQTTAYALYSSVTRVSVERSAEFAVIGNKLPAAQSDLRVHSYLQACAQNPAS